MKKRRNNGKINSADLALAIHEALDMPLDKKNNWPSFGSKIVKIIFKVVAEALNRGEDVYVNGFGKFYTKTPRPYYKLPNVVVASGPDLTNQVKAIEPTIIKGKPKAYFKPSIQLMAMLNHQDPTHKERKAIDRW